MTSRDEEIARYAAQVRVALADLPDADRQELEEDLEDHLAEIAEESSEPLTTRLGAPASYAAELRAAYGAGGGGGRRARRVRGTVDTTKRLLDENPGLQRLWAFLQEFRSTWWLARGYLPALLIWNLVDGYWHLVPNGPGQAFLALAFVLTSAILGVRHKDRPARPRMRNTLVAANTVAVLGLGMFALGGVSVPAWPTSSDYAPVPSEANHYDGGALDGVHNIYPYSKDGKPLKDVLLYDQDGRPLNLPFEEGGWALAQPCGGPPAISNAYPLPLRQPDYDGSGEPGCVPTTPTPEPRPSEDPTESPSGSPSPRETPSPSPSD
ncbi:HAAS signaling domain-containing protein [Thermomonospora umbrina]|uniref:Uncharacterized protein n=1 Tax=Thermomonospora umbrina TaxID=111806 RepID=A0A3D9SJK3_9ACTN|nr:hypothetical protein [Thermomonospora umbrina]REE96118.1 hypothetical protein DFJ69_1543 [Thermomonospora umbrina]